MNWTKERPTQPGYYWVRSGPLGHAWIAELYLGMNPRNTAARRLTRNSTLRVRDAFGHGSGPTVEEYDNKRKFANIHFLPHEWYGPLEPPA